MAVRPYGLPPTIEGGERGAEWKLVTKAKGGAPNNMTSHNLGGL